MVKDARMATDPDSYETWLGSDDAVENLWHTVDGDIFVFTEDGIYLPCEIGPLESESRISPDNFDDYDVTVEFRNDMRPIGLVIGLTTVLFLGGVFMSGGLAVVSLVASVLSLLGLVLMAVKERNKVNALTHITLHMGRHNATVVTEGDVEDTIESHLSSLIQ